MLSTMLELIVGDVNKRKAGLKPPFKRSNHQYCMPNKTVTEACRLFTDRVRDLEKATDFEQLRQIVFRLAEDNLPTDVRANSNRNNFGWLACYDFALRYGYHRMGNMARSDFNLFPASLYLHAGALTGARALCDLGKLDKKWLAPHKDTPGSPIFIPFEQLENMSEFPQGLTNLVPKTEGLQLTEEETLIVRMKRPMHLENFLCIYSLHLKYLAGTATPEEIENFKLKINII